MQRNLGRAKKCGITSSPADAELHRRRTDRGGCASTAVAWVDRTAPHTHYSMSLPTFAIASGDGCLLTNGGTCVASDGYPDGEDYGNEQACEVVVNGGDDAYYLVTRDFDTESVFDVLTIDGEEYSGYSDSGYWDKNPPPPTLTYAAGAPGPAITWRSDESQGGRGWELCITAAAPPSPPSMPPSPSSPPWPPSPPSPPWPISPPRPSPPPPLLPPAPPAPPAPPPSPPLPPLPPGAHAVATAQELRDAIADASLGLLMLLPGTYAVTPAGNGLGGGTTPVLPASCDEAALCITRSVTLQAAVRGTAVIDAQGSGTVLQVSSPDSGPGVHVELSGITITGGLADSSPFGGGLRVVGFSPNALAVVTLSGQTTIRQNHAWIGGAGAMVWDNAQLLVTDRSVISDNHAYVTRLGAEGTAFGESADDYGGGGARAASGGVIRVSGGSAIRGNRAANGGGLAAYGGSTLSISEASQVVDNSASRMGGGVFSKAESDDGSPSIQLRGRSVVRNNSANLEGGGMHIRAVTEAVVEDATVVGNGAGRAGGGLVAESGRILIRGNTSFRANAAPSAANLALRGGTVYVFFPLLPGHWLPNGMCHSNASCHMPEGRPSTPGKACLYCALSRPDAPRAQPSPLRVGRPLVTSTLS